MDEAQQGGVAESKEQKFQRLATKRTQAALEKIRLITNLTGSGYSYTPEQAAKIIGALRAAVNTVEAKFNRVRGTQVERSAFSL